MAARGAQKASEPEPAQSATPAGPAPEPTPAPGSRRVPAPGSPAAAQLLADPRLADPANARTASDLLRAAQRTQGNHAVARALADRDVRIHTDDPAAALARGIGAKAFTRGRDIYFGPGRFAPETGEGRRLLRHELTHVAQRQNAERTGGGPDSAEAELEAEARAAAAGRADEVRGRAAEGIVLRDPGDGEPEAPLGAASSSSPFAPIDWAGIDVAVLPNRELLAELRSNAEWLASNGMVLLEWGDRNDYQNRLNAEKDRRVQTGNVWLDEPDADRLASLMTLAGGGDRIAVSASPATDFLDAAPASSTGTRVLSPQQFQQFLADQGIPTVSEEEWNLALRLQEQQQLLPAPAAGPDGASGTEGDADLLQMGLAAGTAANPWTTPYYGGLVGDRFARGFTSTGAHGVVAEAMWGARQGGLDLNSAWWADSRLSGQPFENLFLREMQRYGPFAARRPFALGPSQGQSGPAPGWFDSGAGWQRGNYPLADFDSRNPFAISPVSVKASIREDWAGRRDFFLEGHAALVGTDQRTGGRSQASYLRNAPPGTTAADIAQTGVLAINPEDVARLRDLYLNPLDIEAPYVEDGRTVTPESMSIERVGVRRVLNGYLQAGPPPVIDGQTYTTAEQLRDAYQAGTITRQQLLDALQPAGRRAAAAVTTHETPRSLLTDLIALRRAQGTGSRSALEILGTGEHFSNQLYGAPRATGISAARGGFGGMLLGGGLQALMVGINPDDYEDPGGAIFDASALGLVSGGAQSAIEHRLIAGATERALTSSTPLTRGGALTLRSSAAGRAGGYVAGGVEIFQILTEDEEHTAEEVVLRVGRAGGIGYVSAATGAAVGTAIGGPVGFIAGLVVGIAVGAVLEAVVPRPGHNQAPITEAIQEIGRDLQWGIENDPAAFVLPFTPTLRNYSRYGGPFPRVRSPLDAMREAEQGPPPIQRAAAAGGAPPSPRAIAAAAAASSPGVALPEALARQAGERLGLRTGPVRLHTDPGAARLAAGISARAFTRGEHVFFASGAYDPGSPSGRRLIGHELAHVAQQGQSGQAVPANAVLQPPASPLEREADRLGHRFAAAAPESGPACVDVSPATPSLQRDEEDEETPDATPATPPNPFVTEYPDDRLLGLLRDDFLTPVYVAKLMGGLRSLEAHQPRSYAVVRERLVSEYGEEAVQGVYDHEAQILDLAARSEEITSALSGLLSHYFETDQDAAWDYINEKYEEHEWDYPKIFAHIARDGAGVLLILQVFLGGDPDEVVEALEANADAAQAEAMELEAQHAEWTEAGAEEVGTTIATKETLFWWDTQLTLESVEEPTYGFATQGEAIAWATTTGVACAVLQVGERSFVYRLSTQYSFTDVMSWSGSHRTEVVQSGSSRATLTTTDGVVLSARDSRFFARDQTANPEEHLAADLDLLATHGSEMTSDQAFRLFKQATRNLVFANLARSRAQLSEELDRFFDLPGLPTMMNLRPAAGEELQRDSAALRRHLMQAASLAESIGDEPTEDERAQLEQVLSAIGAIHSRNPTAALMVVNHRDAEATDPVDEGDFEDRAAGRQSGDVAWEGAQQIGERLRNIDRVRAHLLENSDAVLSLTAVHPGILSQFSPSQQLDIRLRLAFHTMAEVAEVVGMTVLDLALVITGVVVGGPVGLALGGVATVRGVGQTVQAFEHVSLLESMTPLGFTSDTALATPEQVSSARMWSYIGLGLTLLDVGGFVTSATRMARLQQVLASPDLAALLEHTRAGLGEAAEAMGTSEAALARRLSAARGAERARLLEEVRQVLERTASGGRYGHMDWPEGYTPTVLNHMRQALLAETDDVDRIAAAMADFGEPLTPDMLQLIKRYNFDSPGLAFARENYDAWLRLASRRGTISDARYLLHESVEIRALQRAGFDFNPATWAGMGRHARTRWHREFMGNYLRAHAEALGAEYNFMSRQINSLIGGHAPVTPEVVAAVDRSFSGGDAREMMRVGEHLLQDHPSFYAWSSRAGETVALDAAARARLGEGLYNGVLRGGGATRAAAVRDGASPTLRELVSIVRSSPL